MSTNLEAAFQAVLKLAVENNTPSEEMPKSIIVISDMEIVLNSERYEAVQIAEAV